MVGSVETLLPQGEVGDGHDPRIRATIAEGLARQVTVLASQPRLVAQVGPPPAWCDYTHGAWGRTHDSYFDFGVTPPEYAWLREFAQDASDVLISGRNQQAPVAAHGDWYCGNLRFDGARLVATFDWDLIADQEPVVAGIAAATFTGDGTQTAQEAAAFLSDYQDARQLRFSTTQRTMAQAAVRWNIAYSARCDVTNAHGRSPQPGSALDHLRTNLDDYFDMEW